MFEQLADAIAELQEKLAETRSELAKERASRERMFRKGKVTDVDPEKQRYRQEVGVDENGKPVKGAWIPYGQIAGALKVHSPPSVGQQMIQFAPDGDFDQAFGFPLTFSDDNESPSKKGDEDVVTRGKTKDTTRADLRQIETGNASIAVEDGKLKIRVGDVSYTMDGKGHHLEGGIVEHEKHKIDASHKHTNVMPGGGLTGPPE